MKPFWVSIKIARLIWFAIYKFGRIVGRIDELGRVMVTDVLGAASGCLRNIGRDKQHGAMKADRRTGEAPVAPFD